jgi:hypothetical protein
LIEDRVERLAETLDYFTRPRFHLELDPVVDFDLVFVSLKKDPSSEHE